jgi:polyisoprenoid-binding protein YceI
MRSLRRTGNSAAHSRSVCLTRQGKAHEIPVDVAGFDRPSRRCAGLGHGSRQKPARFCHQADERAHRGGFKRFVARASFDPARPEAGRFQIEVDINSIDTGTDDGDAEVKRPVWFDSARHPRATFVSKSVRKEANGSYTALGDMTIKGQTRSFAAPFSLVSQPGGGYVAQGRFPLKRSDFGIGGGDWDEVVANEADIRFKITLLPARKP